MTKEEILKRVKKFQGANREFSQELPPIIEGLIDLIDEAGPEVVDNLESNSPTKALSAKQGKELNVKKQDAPATTGAAGQILQLDEEGKPEWVDAAEVGATYDSAVSDSSTNAIQNKTIKKYVDDTADTKANVNGHYSTLTSGFAENLVDMKGTGSEQEFIRRTSCGDVSISDDGSGVIQELKGKSIVWNQYIKQEVTIGSGTDKWNSFDAGTTLTANNNELQILKSSGLGIAYYSLPSGTVVNGHTYLIAADIKTTAPAGSIYVSAYGADTIIDIETQVEISGWQRIAEIATAVNASNQQFRITDSRASDFDTVYAKNFILADLTLMFGAGNEPVTVAQFEALYPGYHGYNPGIIKNNDADGIETVGFNQFDESTLIDGEWRSDDNIEQSVAGRRASDDYFLCFPSTDYRMTFTGEVGNFCVVINWYDASKNWISGVKYGEGPVVTSPANAAFFRVSSAEAVGNICINLSWSGYRNGEYEAYWQRTLNLGITTATGKLNGEGESVTIFPEGMAGVGTAYDGGKSDSTGYIREVDKRIGVVDLGDLDYVADSGGYKTSIPDIAVKNTQGAVAALLAGYEYDYNLTADKTYSMSMNNTNVWIRNDAYATADAFKAAMAGVKLWYELATPEHYVLDTPIPTTYKVADFGTETAVAPSGATTPSAPFVAVIKYNDDFTRILATRNKLMLSKESATNLLTALQSAGIIASYTMTYDATDDEYDFTITAPSE